MLLMNWTRNDSAFLGGEPASIASCRMIGRRDGCQSASGGRDSRSTLGETNAASNSVGVWTHCGDVVMGVKRLRNPNTYCIVYEQKKGRGVERETEDSDATDCKTHSDFPRIRRSVRRRVQRDGCWL
jgi:hypothetical protein